ncbi:hypothetical protein BU23DRAFT_118851 [Bimuria novae-zelandiae CBS 107.79]|uniref:Uncharacterized protein n=1 Tax=Bimuria novae-zelandiae CBS 107.79 TaxID=1447943 RepID=A0A6A5VDX9_9PLEO|nr:hypothetical protein BU23DRAFT_118851 [Bimuria novae-zelandiae CBS 107.79]
MIILKGFNVGQSDRKTLAYVSPKTSSSYIQCKSRIIGLGKFTIIYRNHPILLIICICDIDEAGLRCTASERVKDVKIFGVLKVSTHPLTMQDGSDPLAAKRLVRIAASDGVPVRRNQCAISSSRSPG